MNGKACVYCGKNEGTTKDHVIPKCLFEKPLPQNMITIPACEECNNEAKSTDDSFLRDLLVTDVYSGSNPMAAAGLEKVARASQRKQSEFNSDFLSKLKPTPFFSHGGVYLGEALSAPLDVERVERIFARMIRGLHFSVAKVRIPDDYVFRVNRYHPQQFQEVLDASSSLKLKGPLEIGKVFWAVRAGAQEDPCVGLYLFSFFRSACFSVLACSSTQAKNLPVDSKRQWGARS